MMDERASAIVMRRSEAIPAVWRVEYTRKAGVAVYVQLLVPRHLGLQAAAGVAQRLNCCTTGSILTMPLAVHRPMAEHREAGARVDAKPRSCFSADGVKQYPIQSLTPGQPRARSG